MKLYFGLPLKEYFDNFFTEFNIYFEHLIEDEGDYLPGKQARKIKDPGGATNYGISLKFLQDCGVDVGDLNNDGVVDEKDIVVLTREQARELYFKYFWNPLYPEMKHIQMINRVFNFGVNAGRKISVKLLQRSVNKILDIKLLKIDGVFGKDTLGAVTNVDKEKLYREYVVACEDYYRSLNKPQFINGWLRRLSHILPDSTVRKIKEWRDRNG